MIAFFGSQRSICYGIKEGGFAVALCTQTQKLFSRNEVYMCPDLRWVHAAKLIPRRLVDGLNDFPTYSYRLA